MHFGGIILAAGTSSRLGRPKQLIELEEKIVLQHVVDAVAASNLDEIVIVLGHEADEVETRLMLPTNARIARAGDYQLGQSASLRAGLSALSAGCSGAIVVLGDQPRIDPAAIRRLVEEFQPDKTQIVQATYRGTPGHPVLFAREMWRALENLEGDVGARELIKQNPDWISRVEMGTPPPSDLDTEEDLEKLRRGS